MFTHVLVKSKNLQRAVRQRQNEIPDKQLRIMKVKGKKKKKRDVNGDRTQSYHIKILLNIESDSLNNLSTQVPYEALVPVAQNILYTTAGVSTN